MSPVGRALIGAGALLILVGLGLTFAHRVPFLGRLPGDFVFRRGAVSVYIPLATCLILSVLLTLVLSLLRR